MRPARIERNTRETRIAVALDLDGIGRASVSTGTGFLDHVLARAPRAAIAIDPRRADAVPSTKGMLGSSVR